MTTDIYLIRHGATKGNLEHRYVGRTEEGILQNERERLRKIRQDNRLPEAELVFCSPLVRCRETAEMLYPEKEAVVIEDFRECDFGEFEYRNYAELNGNEAYQRFIDSGGESGFPGGETKREFQARCAQAFQKVVRQLADRQRAELANPEGQKSVVFVVHGGTIMAILDAFSEPHRDYYSWQVKNGEGYHMRLELSEAETDFYLRDITALKFT